MLGSEIPAAFLLKTSLYISAKQPKSQIPQLAAVWRRASVSVCEKGIKMSVHSGALTSSRCMVLWWVSGTFWRLEQNSVPESDEKSSVQSHFNVALSKLETGMRNSSSCCSSKTTETRQRTNAGHVCAF